MSIITFLNRVRTKAVRFRHRKGYGVHSPFAFNLINEVIYESGFYYPYHELAILRRRANVALPVSKRTDKLMFRLSNRLLPQKAVVVGARRGITAQYIAAGSSRTIVEEYESTADMPDKGCGLCYVAPDEDFLEAFERFARSADDKSVFVAAGIYKSKNAKAGWKALCTDPRAIVTFDLYETGIVFFNSKLNKQNYIVCF